MITFVTFHVGNWGALKNRNEINLFFKSLNIHHPDCKKVVLTDTHTNFFHLNKDIEIHRYEVDSSKIIFSRLIAYINYLKNHDFSTDIVLSDRWYLLTAYLAEHNFVSWMSGFDFTNRFEEIDLC